MKFDMKQVEIRVSGKNTLVPAAEICGRTVIAKGGRIKIASVLDEVVAPGELVKDPDKFIAAFPHLALHEFHGADNTSLLIFTSREAVGRATISSWSQLVWRPRPPFSLRPLRWSWFVSGRISSGLLSGICRP